MALSVPETPKTKTKIYENFKGIDLTNDSTNVWYRRSPSGVNMLPDASGRPFKRYGWEVKVTTQQLATLLNISSTEIKRCFYFELAGKDHIIIFCDGGVVRFFDEQLTTLTTDVDFWGSSDRAFFFSGNGKAAFYIYGNKKVFSYEYNVESETYVWGLKGYSTGDDALEGDGIYVPQVLAGCTADGTGTNIEGYNLLGDRARYEYQGSVVKVDNVDVQSCILFKYGTVGDFTVNVDTTTLAQNPYTIGHKYTFVYDEDETNWNLTDTTLSTGAEVTTSDISTATLKTTYGIVSITGGYRGGNSIEIIYVYGVQLPVNVSTNTSELAKVRVLASTVSQFDTEFTRYTSGTFGDKQYKIHTDTTNEAKAWIEFASAVTWSVLGEDYIRVIVPINDVRITSYDTTIPKLASGTGSLVR